MTSLVSLGASELARLVHTRQVSSREIIAAFLARIADRNPVFNAIVSQRPDEDVLREADEADALLARGGRVGPLHGLPIAVKDLSATKGLRTTFGSPILADFVPETDSILVERLRRAGAIIIGKTNTPEFGLGSHTYNPVFGVTRNAFDPSKSAGGSSGGTAVAVALHMLPVADGSDFGGSLRNPAAFNNIFGFRPSQGRVPSWPAADPFFSQLGTDGPMARRTEDLALLFDVIAGYDRRAPLSLEKPSTSYTNDRRPIGQPRIGWLGDLSGHLPFEPNILELCEAALKSTSTIGCHVDEVRPRFDFEALWKAFVVLRQFNLSARLKPLHDDPEKRALLKPEACWEVEGCLGLSAVDILAASQTRAAWYTEVLRLFDSFDYLAIPSAQVFPFDVNKHWPDEIAGRKMDSYHRWMEVVALATLSGCPVVNVPVGFSDGLPMGMQLIGRPRADGDVLALARAYEEILPFETGAPLVA
ncbi:amidase (plasmid) [Agrobacterium leguminum]|uniref:amidase n=1 Tax=Agrobacterium leguminum TaxID=2792015 RepID=UPI002729D872|nr:amidase [Agrobacterium leguminum]WLE00775.1 amidase [Agrobacterium leguminum]